MSLKLEFTLADEYSVMIVAECVPSRVASFLGVFCMKFLIHMQAIAALFLIACNSEETSNPNAASAGSDTAASATDWSSKCTASCDWERRCASATDPASPTCQTDCESDTTKPEVFREDSLAILQRCFATLACGTSDDQCYTQATAAVAADPTGDPRCKSCLDRYESCASSAPGSFSDDICYQRLILTYATQAPIDTCLAGACAQVHDCIATVLGTN